MEDQLFLVPGSLINGILAYLRKRPYEEVAQAIQALMQSRAYQPEAPAQSSEAKEKADEPAAR